MTRNEVEGMSNKELQAKTAELLGWRYVKDRWIAPGENEILVLASALGHERQLPNWLNDSTIAMELWNTLLESGHTVELFSHRPECYAVVVGFPHNGNYAYSEDIEENSPSLAITRAFVYAMAGDKDE